MISNDELAAATRLTRAGRLMEATEAIQRALRGSAAPAGQDNAAVAPERPRAVGPLAGALATGGVTDVVFRDKPAPAATPADDATDAAPDVPSPSVATPDLSGVPRQTQSRPSSFTRHEFLWGTDRYPYRLFVPAGTPDAGALPLVVMLHGCKQDSADFAAGTAMNAVAQELNCLVLYPEQLSRSNSMGCWNWFEPAHQGRAAGEPAMIAALTRSVLRAHGGDASRTYVAGLSAGGAMAALVANLHPELFAAVGVHSGLPAGAAHDMVSAFSAMRKGAYGARGAAGPSAPLPTVVFHGTADKTVDPKNADAITRSALRALQGTAVTANTEPVAAGPGGRAATRTRYTAADGRVMLERWTVSGGPHAWSGGNAGGSFTDPAGPDASRAMLRFFLAHHLVGAKSDVV